MISEKATRAPGREYPAMDISILHQGHTPAIQQLAEECRQLVLSIQPTAHQEIEPSWGGYLLFKQVAGAGNTVCWVSPNKKHVSLGFSSPIPPTLWPLPKTIASFPLPTWLTKAGCRSDLTRTAIGRWCASFCRPVTDKRCELDLGRG